MKTLLTTTALALLLANGVAAESHTTAEDSTDATENSDTMVEEVQETAPDAEAMDGEEAETMDDGETETMEADDTETMDADTSTSVDAGSTDMSTTPTMAMDGYSTVMGADITAEQMEDADVYGVDDEEIGEIHDLVISDDGMIQQVIVDVGGFLGLGEKSVALDFTTVQILMQDDGDDLRVYIPYTEEQLEGMEEYEAEM